MDMAFADHLTEGFFIIVVADFAVSRKIYGVQ